MKEMDEKAVDDESAKTAVEEEKGEKGKEESEDEREPHARSRKIVAFSPLDNTAKVKTRLRYLASLIGKKLLGRVVDMRSTIHQRGINMLCLHGVIIPLIKVTADPLLLHSIP